MLYLICMQLGLLLPPHGLLLMTMKGVAPPQVTMAHIFRAVVPYVAHEPGAARAADRCPADRDLAARAARLNPPEVSLRIAVVGGGPGGLYFAYLWKRRHPAAQIDVFEQNPAGATWGFGVVFSDQALEFLRADDPETVDAIAPHMESWKNITLTLRGERVEIDGVGFSAIGRLQFLDLLRQRLASVGFTPQYQRQIQSVDEFTGYDLIVGADGLNSVVRRSYEGDFGTSLSYSSNKFAWYGTSKLFPNSVADIRRDRTRRVQCASLSLFQFDEHVHRRMRPRHVAALRLCGKER